MGHRSPAMGPWSDNRGYSFLDSLADHAGVTSAGPRSICFHSTARSGNHGGSAGEGLRTDDHGLPTGDY